MYPHVWSALTFLILFCLAALPSLSVANRPPNRNRNRGRNHHQDGDRQQMPNNPYAIVCPSVVCPLLPDTCQTREYIIQEVSFMDDSGRQVRVQCRSCEYCMDLPSDLRRAGRRSRRHHHDCTRVVCPEVTSDCTDVRPTDMLLGDTTCLRCPACYDDTVFSRT